MPYVRRSFLPVYSLLCLLWALPVWAEDGEVLAKFWCSSCHAFPEPQLLDKDTWHDHILPEMGARLGFQTFRGRDFGANPNAPVGIYPSEPLIDLIEWEQIISWYETNAPDKITLPDWQPRTRLELFEIEQPAGGKSDFPTGTAVHIDATDNRLLVGDSYELDIEIYADDLNLLEVVRSGGAISRIQRLPLKGYLATIMGGNIGQSELLLGLLIEISGPIVTRLVPRLHRPVDMVFGDFNKDGKTDYVIAEFGTYAGKLSLHLSQSNGTLRETVLLHDGGVLSLAIAGDDLLVLIAQGDERILRLNDFASGYPVIETLVRFPPSQGSSSLSVLDFNDDGLLDLLYTAGDNADISPIFKVDHGVYLYAGQPDNSFRQEMFFHLDGTTSAIAEDFDQDGDLDIAAIAYYPNIARGVDETGFVYLQNNDGSFDPKYIDGIGTLGRFIAISAGDIDGDGDIDIALANLAFGPYGPLDVSPELQDKWLSGTHFILLRNGLIAP